MMRKTRSRRLAAGARGRALALAFVAASIPLACNDDEPAPTSSGQVAVPDPLNVQLPLRFNIAGHWEGGTDQGRRIAFDVSEDGVVKNGRINLHHNCSVSFYRMTLDGYRADVNDHSFTASMNWRIVDRAGIYSGEISVSGRFESDGSARGGFINSIVRKPANDGLGDCESVHGTWDAAKE